MGAIADGIVAYAQPLVDQTDGSIEQANKALSIGQICFNLALLPEAERDAAIAKFQPSLQMDDTEFEAFRRTIIDPMIRRHEEMFPLMHQGRSSQRPNVEPMPQIQPISPAPSRKYQGIGRNAPCPCNSGRKFKHCCKG